MSTQLRIGQPMIKGRAPRSPAPVVACDDAVRTGTDLAPRWDSWVATNGLIGPRRLGDLNGLYGVWIDRFTNRAPDSPATAPLLLRGWFYDPDNPGDDSNDFNPSTSNPRNDTYHARSFWESSKPAPAGNEISLNVRTASVCAAAGTNSEEYAIIPCEPGHIVTVSGYVAGFENVTEDPLTPVFFSGETTPSARISLIAYGTNQGYIDGIFPSYTVLSSTYAEISTTMAAPSGTAYITAAVTFRTGAWGAGGPNEGLVLVLDLADIRVSVT
jgi:hypothetical protein